MAREMSCFRSSGLNEPVAGRKQQERAMRAASALM